MIWLAEEVRFLCKKAARKFHQRHLGETVPLNLKKSLEEWKGDTPVCLKLPHDYVAI